MSRVVIPHIVSTKFDKAFKCNKKWTNGQMDQQKTYKTEAQSLQEVDRTHAHKTVKNNEPVS